MIFFVSALGISVPDPDFLSLKNDVNVPSKSNKHKYFFKTTFCGRLEGQCMAKIARSGSKSGSISLRHGSADPDPDSRSTPECHESGTLLGI
jgi:hypothetical protein